MEIKDNLEVVVTDQYGHYDESMGAILTNQKKLEKANNLKKEKERIKEKQESEVVKHQLVKTLKSFFLNSSFIFQRFSVSQETHGLYRTTSIVIHLSENNVLIQNHEISSTSISK